MRLRSSILRAAAAATLLLASAPPLPAAGSPGSGPVRARHLLGQTSPYLQEHLDNPVDWYPWGEEALEKARAGNKPIFLSIGYSACHWCHVMERETFSDEGIAALLNDGFVSIKVDREERPDLDAVYMSAVLMMTGRGGWPMTVFLTPDRRPFFGGTYFPKDRFRELVLGVGQAWKERRTEVESAASRIAAAVAAHESVEVSAASPDLGAGRIREAVPALAARFDAAHGGFGTAPKFPPYGALALLLETHRRYGDREALDMAVRTLDAMARGGIYDQVGGGFHRYSTDARWFAPHFEKMLYDNALLVPLYLRAWRQAGREDFRRVAEETLAWVRREMTAPEGGFYATLDADSEGEEGRFYLWSAAEGRRALGKEAELLLGYFGATAAGNFEGGRNILHVPVPPARFARERGLEETDLRRRVEAGRRSLLRARDGRVRPHRDEKILSGWNGLMISAFAAAHAATGDPAHRAAAAGAARFILGRPGGSDGLRVSWRDGRAGPPAFLDDYAFMARGLLDLHEATGEREWLDEAARLVRAAERFRDGGAGGYFLAGPERQDLIVRPMRLEDEAIPSGNAVLAECQVRLAQRLGDAALREAALGILRLAAPGMASDPASHATLILAAARLDEPAPVLRAADRGMPFAGAVLAAERDSGGGVVAAAATPGAPAAGAGEKVIRGTIVGRPNIHRVVESSFAVPDLPVRPGQALTLSLRLDLAKGWHVNSAHPTLDYLIATKVEFPDAGVARVDEIAYPPGHLVTLKFADEKLSVYEGSATIRATVRPLPEGPPGPRELRARLVYQACNDTTCLPPETVEFRLPIRVEGEAVPLPPLPAAGAGSGAVAGSGAPGEGDGGATRGPGGEEAGRLAGLLREGRWGLLLGVVFLGGLALNLTPCVYPILPVTIGFFSGQSAGTWGRRILLPTLYVLGMAVTYSALGVTAGLSGGLFGAALQSVWVVGGLVVLFVAMALWLFGVYELRLPGALTSLGSGRRGAAGALVMGLTMGLVAAPCIGPFVVGLLAFVSAAGDPVLGFWLFFVMAIGMGLPNLVLGIFSGAVAALPRSGAWLIYAKKVMGIAMLAVALYFLQPFLSDRVLGWFALVFAVGAGFYLAFLERTRGRTRAFQAARLATGVAVVVAGSWVSLPLVQARPALVWEPYSHEAFAAPETRGRPIIIDFSAEWCLPCKELERFTFTDPRVIEEGARFRLLKADLTQFESEHVRHMKERFQVVGVPTLVFLDGTGKEREDLRLFGFEPPEAFLRRLQQVR